MRTLDFVFGAFSTVKRKGASKIARGVRAAGAGGANIRETRPSPRHVGRRARGGPNRDRPGRRGPPPEASLAHCHRGEARSLSRAPHRGSTSSPWATNFSHSDLRLRTCHNVSLATANNSNDLISVCILRHFTNKQKLKQTGQNARMTSHAHQPRPAEENWEPRSHSDDCSGQ